MGEGGALCLPRGLTSSQFPRTPAYKCQLLKRRERIFVFNWFSNQVRPKKGSSEHPSSPVDNGASELRQEVDADIPWAVHLPHRTPLGLGKGLLFPSILLLLFFSFLFVSTFDDSRYIKWCGLKAMVFFYVVRKGVGSLRDGVANAMEA